jgi:hypothetical protein
MHSRLAVFVWVAGLAVLTAYVVVSSVPSTTHGFIAYYAASRLLLTHQLGPWVYDDPSFMRYVQGRTGEEPHAREHAAT